MAGFERGGVPAEAAQPIKMNHQAEQSTRAFISPVNSSYKKELVGWAHRMPPATQSLRPADPPSAPRPAHSLVPFPPPSA